MARSMRFAPFTAWLAAQTGALQTMPLSRRR